MPHLQSLPSRCRFAAPCIAALVISMLAGLADPAQAAPSRRPAASPFGRNGRRNAFHPTPLPSKAVLLSRLRADSRFRQNLARHFRVGEGELISYVQENLQLIRNDRSRSVTVYGVTQEGHIFPAKQRLEKGALVYGLPDGTLVIKEICGNPVGTKLPPVGVRAAMRGPVVAPEIAPIEEGPLPALALADTPPPTAPGPIPSFSTTGPAAPDVFAVDTQPELAGEQMAMQPEEVAGVVAILPAVGGGMSLWPASAAVLPLAFLVGGGGGDDNGGTGIDKDKDCDGGGGGITETVPEPGAWALMAAGCLPLLGVARGRFSGRRPR